MQIGRLLWGTTVEAAARQTVASGWVRVAQPWGGVVDPLPDDYRAELTDSAPRVRGQVRDERDGLPRGRTARSSLLVPRQRAALLLRDVLGFTAAEFAPILLDTIHESVSSALERARASFARQQESGAGQPPPPQARRTNAPPIAK